MRAILTALLLTVATQAGADDAELNPDEWTFLEYKYADGVPLKIVTGEDSQIPILLAIAKIKPCDLPVNTDFAKERAFVAS